MWTLTAKVSGQRRSAGCSGVLYGLRGECAALRYPMTLLCSPSRLLPVRNQQVFVPHSGQDAYNESFSVLATRSNPKQRRPPGRFVHSMSVSQLAPCLSALPYSMTRSTPRSRVRNCGCSVGISPFEFNQCQGSTINMSQRISQTAERSIRSIDASDGVEGGSGEDVARS